MCLATVNRNVTAQSKIWYLLVWQKPCQYFIWNNLYNKVCFLEWCVFEFCFIGYNIRQCIMWYFPSENRVTLMPRAHHLKSNQLHVICRFHCDLLSALGCQKEYSTLFVPHYNTDVLISASQSMFSWDSAKYTHPLCKRPGPHLLRECVWTNR